MTPRRIRRRFASACVIATLAAMAIFSAPARADGLAQSADGLQSAAGASDAPVPVEALVAEAMRQSPEISAARSHWEGQSRVPIQVSTLPDPDLTMQQLTVGSPQPFSGYETSDFYYTGFGVSQEIPGPGKLGLRAKQAEKDADYARASLEASERRIAERVREDAFNLFYLTRARDLLEQTRAQLDDIERSAESQYRTGRAQQQDVLKAQLAMTSILKDLAMNHGEIAAAQASLKAMLGREQDSRDIAIADVTPTPMKIDESHLSAAAESGSAELAMARAMKARSIDSLDLARHDYWPDFSVGYMYQKAGPGFRDYYMLTLGAKVPLYFWRKQTPAVEQAASEKQSAESQFRATRLEALSDLQSSAVAMRTQERIITMFRDGLIPQATATLASATAAYRTGKVDFQTLLAAVIDLLNLREGYVRAIADHEIAAARIKQIVGDQFGGQS